MLPLMLGLIGFGALVLVAAMKDRIGFGLLMSTNVEPVADARVEEPPLGIPPLYLAACAVAGAGAVMGFPEAPPLARWSYGVLFASFLLLTMWDIRRRRGTLAVYIRLRRAEIGFQPRGDVIEVPHLVFLVMNQPSPIVWLLTAIALTVGSIALIPRESWPTMLPIVAVSIAIVWLWLRNRRSPWEPLARRLRWLSLRSGERLTEPLERALELDPEVALYRNAADSMVARVMGRE